MAALIEYGASVSMDSLMIARNGRIVAEAYYAPFRASMRHRVNSATKAVIGTLTGIAIARGEMPATTTPVLELFPGASDTSDQRWRKMTVQHLLDMTSGISWDEPLTNGIPRTSLAMERSPNWADFILAQPIAQLPGAAFNYNSGNPHLLSVALMRRTGIPTDDYARRFLFEPLGITDFRWRKDPQGAAIGGFGLYMHTRDMARLGQLYLQHGKWGDRQLVPNEWVDHVFAPKVDMSIPGFRYSDFWWSIPSKRAYMMVGFNRQVVMVLPDQNIVAAMTGRFNYPFEDVISRLQRASKSAEPLPENIAAQAALRARAEVAANGGLLPVDVVADSTVKPAVVKGNYRVEENQLGVREVGFDFSVSPPIYRVLMRSRSLIAPLSLDGRFAEGDDGGTPLFTRARWQDPNTLVLEQRWPEEAASMRYVMKFSGNDLEITGTNHFGVKAVVKALRRAEE